MYLTWYHRSLCLLCVKLITLLPSVWNGRDSVCNLPFSGHHSAWFHSHTTFRVAEPNYRRTHAALWLARRWGEHDVMCAITNWMNDTLDEVILLSLSDPIGHPGQRVTQWASGLSDRRIFCLLFYCIVTLFVYKRLLVSDERWRNMTFLTKIDGHVRSEVCKSCCVYLCL